MNRKMKTIRQQVLQHETELLGGRPCGDFGGYIVSTLTSALKHPVRGYQLVEKQTVGPLEQHGECGIRANQQPGIGSARAAAANVRRGTRSIWVRAFYRRRLECCRTGAALTANGNA